MLKLLNHITHKLHCYVWRRWFWDGRDSYTIELTAEEMQADKIVIYPIDQSTGRNP